MILDSSVTNFFAIKRFSTLEEDFIKRYEDRFSYDESIYKGTKFNIEIKCNKHNKSFYQTPVSFLHDTSGCEDCRREEYINKNGKLFIEKATAKFPEYDYSKVVYTYAKSKVEIICKTHGSFFITPSDFMTSKGCQKCTKDRMGELYSFTEEQLSNNITTKYGDQFRNFDFKGYKNNHSKIKIECKDHGVFETTYAKLIRENNCPKCIIENRQLRKAIPSNIIKDRLYEKFEDRIVLVEDTYKSTSHLAKFICKDHGEFSAKPTGIFNWDYGCPTCSHEARIISKTKPFKEFVEEATLKFGNKFTYIESSYKNSHTKMNIVCSKHGIINMIPTSHLISKFGCLECARDSGLAFNAYFDRPTTLYYIKISKDNKEFYKVGITTTPVEKRFCMMSRDNATYEVISTKLFDTGLLAYNIEQEILRSNRNIKIDYVLLEKTGGNSEILTEDIYSTIKHYFEQE